MEHLDKALSWLQAKWIERQILLKAKRYDAHGVSDTVQQFAPVQMGEFHDFLLTINAPTLNTVDQCRERGWIVPAEFGRITGKPTHYSILPAVNAKHCADNSRFFCDPSLPADVQQMVEILNSDSSISQRKAAAQTAVATRGKASSIEKRFRHHRDKTKKIRHLSARG